MADEHEHHPHELHEAHSTGGAHAHLPLLETDAATQAAYVEQWPNVRARFGLMPVHIKKKKLQIAAPRAEQR